jgi:prophage tail gpP-like protein
METASASFDLDVFDRWAEKSEPWPIFDGDEVRVWIGSDLLVEGYVDRVSIAIDATSRGMRVSGRDRTADLVDCSAMNRPGTFKNKKLEELAQILAQPFGVKVAADVDTGDRIASFTLLPGEKVHEAISRAAIAKNLLVTSGLSGTLSLTRSGSIKSHDSVVEGVNLLAGDTDISSTERFSDYVVEGQASGQGRNNLRATFRDAGVNRYRPLMLCAEQKPTQAFLKSRVEWEARSRAAKSRTARITLAGWRQSSGELWQINRLIPVKSASLGLDEELLIGEVTFELSDSGMLTSLALVRPDAFTSAAELQAGKDLARLRRKGARKRKASASSFVPEFNYDER